MKKNKSFFNEVNPAMQFISAPGLEVIPEKKNHLKRAIKKSIPHNEKKSRRMQLLLKPSLFVQLQKKAKRDRLSLNEMIHIVLTEFFEKEEVK